MRYLVVAGNRHQFDRFMAKLDVSIRDDRQYWTVDGDIYVGVFVPEQVRGYDVQNTRYITTGEYMGNKAWPAVHKRYKPKDP